MNRLAFPVALVAACAASFTAVPHATRSQGVHVIRERVALTYYLPTGSRTASGVWPSEGASAGCGYDVPLGALAVFQNGTYVTCHDRGLTTGPWIDLYADSDEDGYAMVAERATAVINGSFYADVTFTWSDDDE